MTDPGRSNNISERRSSLSTPQAVEGMRTPHSTLEQTYSFDTYQSQGGDINFDTWFSQHLVDFDSVFQAG
jgi:hypothetical protein